VKSSWAYLGVLTVALALAGCGQSSSESDPPERVSAENSSTIQFESPGVPADGVIPAKYSCGAGSIWIPLEWGSVPPGTKELAVYLGRYSGGKGGSQRPKVPFGVLITHIDPSTRDIPAGTLPPNSYWVAHNTFNSCGMPRKGQNMLLQVFALKRPLRTPISMPVSDWATRLTETGLGDDPPPGGPKWVAEITEGALANGQFTATYGQR